MSGTNGTRGRGWTTGTGWTSRTGATSLHRERFTSAMRLSPRERPPALDDQALVGFELAAMRLMRW
jgi:hypothetical protein